MLWHFSSFFFFFLFTYVDEVGSVLTGHAKANVPPEARVCLHHLWREEANTEKMIETAAGETAAGATTSMETRSPLQLPSTLRQLERGMFSGHSPKMWQRAENVVLQRSRGCNSNESERIRWIYQLLLHRRDVLRTSIDQSRVVLAEQHREEDLFTWRGRSSRVKPFGGM